MLIIKLSGIDTIILRNQPILLENVALSPRKPICILAKNAMIGSQYCAISITFTHKNNNILLKNNPVNAYAVYVFSKVFHHTLYSGHLCYRMYLYSRKIRMPNTEYARRPY